MARLHSDGQRIPGTFTNDFLAHLQVAAASRFSEGKGFFLTVTEENSDGTETTYCHWLHPSIPLAFHYDIGTAANRVAPVTLDHKRIDTIADEMELPNGVRGSEAVWWPFHQPL